MTATATLLTKEQNNALEILLKKVDSIIRGNITIGNSNKNGTMIENDEMVTHSLDILNTLCHTIKKTINFLSDDALVTSGKIDVSSNEYYVKMAVNMHNKARMLTNDSHQLLKIILKNIASIILYIYSKQSNDSLITVLKILLKENTELKKYPGNIYQKISVFNSMLCSHIWYLNNLTSTVSPLVFDEIGSVLCNDCLESAVIASNSMTMISNSVTSPVSCTGSASDTSDVIDCDYTSLELKKLVSSAYQLLPSLSIGMKIQFSYKANDIASQLLQRQALNEDNNSKGDDADDTSNIFDFVITLLNMSLNNIEVLLSSFKKNKGNGNATDDAAKITIDLHLLSTDTRMLIAYTFKELKQYERALSCINVIEEDKAILSLNPCNQTIKTSIEWLKLQIYIKNGNIMQSDTCFRTLVTVSDTYKIPLDAAKMILDKQQTNYKVSQVYFMLTSKFSKDPDYSDISIHRIKYLIVNSTLYASPSICNTASMSHYNEGENEAAEHHECGLNDIYNLCTRLVEDHVARKHVMTSIQLNEVSSSIKDRIRHHQSKANEANRVLPWADLYLLLHCDQSMNSCSDCNNLVTILLIKSDCFLDLSKYEDALQASMKAVQLQKSTRTLMILFKSLLHARAPQDAVNNLIALQKDRDINNTTIDQNQSDDVNQYKIHSEDLVRIMMALNITHTDTKLSRDKIFTCKTLLLEAWMRHYVDYQIWKNASSVPCDTSNAFFVDSNDIKLNNRLETYYGIACMYVTHILDEAIVPVTTHIHSSGHSNNPLYADTMQEDHSNEHMQSLQSHVSLELKDFSDKFAYISTSTGQHMFRFNGTLEYIRSTVLKVLNEVKETIATLVNDENGINSAYVESLGTYDELEWLSDIAWNMGVLLQSLGNEVINFPDITSSSSTDAATAEYQSHQIVSAEFVEASDILYSFVEYDDHTITLRNRSISLLLASALRLDYMSNDVSAVDDEMEVALNPPREASGNESMMSMKGSDASISVTDFIENSSNSINNNEGGHSGDKVSMVGSIGRNSYSMRLLFKNLESADVLIHELIANQQTVGISRTNNSGYDILQYWLLLLYHATSKFKPTNELVQLILAKEDDMLCLKAVQLKEFADIAINLNLPNDIIRIILNHSMQACNREFPTNYSLAGSLFYHLIKMSPSRAMALEKIEEFEQLIKSAPKSSNGSKEGGAISTYLVDDIDEILAITYNYGLTLVDLDQVDLAERFISKSLGLITYASSSFQEYQIKIQEMYTSVLELKKKQSEIRMHPFIKEQSAVFQTCSNYGLSSISDDVRSNATRVKSQMNKDAPLTYESLI